MPMPMPAALSWCQSWKFQVEPAVIVGEPEIGTTGSTSYPNPVLEVPTWLANMPLGSKVPTELRVVPAML